MAYQRVDWNKERKNLENSIGDDLGNIQMLCADKDDTIVFDLVTARELRFRLAPHTKESLMEMLHFGDDAGFDDARKTHIIDKILQFPPELMVSCRGIIIAKSYEDLKSVLSSLYIGEDNIPDQILNEDADGLNENLVGLNWYQESMVIINMDSIEKTAQELVQEIEQPWREATEIDIGFWTTLIHELRHNQIDGMPYEVPWLKNGDEAESAVESWALEFYEETV